jgi:hypothetical protein
VWSYRQVKTTWLRAGRLTDAGPERAGVPGWVLAAAPCRGWIDPCVIESQRFLELENETALLQEMPRERQSENDW